MKNCRLDLKMNIRQLSKQKQSLETQKNFDFCVQTKIHQIQCFVGRRKRRDRPPSSHKERTRQNFDNPRPTSFILPKPVW